MDTGLAAQQWQGYVEALEYGGWKTVEVPPVDECPDGVFVEDTMVVFGDLAVIARPGAEQRRPETTLAEQAVAQQGYRIAHIRAPGTPLVDDVAAFPRFMAVPEDSGSHVVLLGERRVLMAASAPATARVLGGMGYGPVVVDISEYEKLEGCVTCLSVRLRGRPGVVA